MVELLIVVGVGTLLTAIAIPQMIGQRRLLRTTAVTRQISAQMRYARQLSMSQRDAITFQYDDTLKQIKIIDHNNNQPTNLGCNVMPGYLLLADPSYPNTACSTVVLTIPLAQAGLPSSELSYGIPTGLPTAALADGSAQTSLTSTKLNITFQPDGRVLDATGNPANSAMFIHNNKLPQGTASAISVMGASGRVKIWRYSNSGNSYAE